ncbi:Mariner Mos1 transposase [Eumeta japonica]|uniref:Mariner Mos1 transposase n=1 Tax=Eumeta variegata TaxID=151549 RepID=A0A4C1ZTP2_EUMVA|nr:Mariner Mos1 transposase [Eumeta japonica]
MIMVAVTRRPKQLGFLEGQKIKLTGHPPYTPDLAPNNFYLFRNVKNTLRAEAHRWLLEAYNEAALSERTCREWFQKFKNGDFVVVDKNCSGRPKTYEDAELKKLLEEDSSQTQKEFSLTLEVTQQAVSHCLKSLGMIRKQGNLFPHELKPKDVECQLRMSEMLLARHK